MEFRCEYRDENDAQVVLRGTLRAIHKQVGARPVTLDGVPGHFQIGDDEAATPQFVIDRRAQQ